MTVDISDTLNHQKDINVADSLLVDITAIRTALNAVVTKLNADAWVTDTDYAAAPALTTVV